MAIFEMILFSILMKNIRCTFYGNQTSDYFKCKATTFENIRVAGLITSIGGKQGSSLLKKKWMKKRCKEWVLKVHHKFRLDLLIHLLTKKKYLAAQFESFS